MKGKKRLMSFFEGTYALHCATSTKNDRHELTKRRGIQPGGKKERLECSIGMERSEEDGLDRRKKKGR